MEKLELAAGEGDDSTPLPTLPTYSLLGGMQTVGSGNLVKHSSSYDGSDDSASKPSSNDAVSTPQGQKEVKVESDPAIAQAGIAGAAAGTNMKQETIAISEPVSDVADLKWNS